MYWTEYSNERNSKVAPSQCVNMGNDTDLTKDEIHRLYFNYSPVGEFLKETARKYQSHLLWFILGIFLVQPVLIASTDRSLSELVIIGWYPGLAPLAVTTIGCSILIYKFLLIQEYSLHSQPPFNTPSWIKKQRIALILLSIVFSLTILIPLFYGMNIPEGKPASPFSDTFLQISTLSAVLCYKYVSKILWDVLEPSKHMFRAMGILLLALAAIMILLLNIPIFSNVDISPRQNTKLLFTSGVTIMLLYLGISSQLNKFRDSYPEDAGKPQSRLLSIIRESRLVSIGAGAIVGVGLPLAASVHTVQSAGLDYRGMPVTEHLIIGYMNAILGVVALIWAILTMTLVIAILFGCMIVIERIVKRLQNRLKNPE